MHIVEVFFLLRMSFISDVAMLPSFEFDNKETKNGIRKYGHPSVAAHSILSGDVICLGVSMNRSIPDSPDEMTRVCKYLTSLFLGDVCLTPVFEGDIHSSSFMFVSTSKPVGSPLKYGEKVYIIHEATGYYLTVVSNETTVQGNHSRLRLQPPSNTLVPNSTFELVSACDSQLLLGFVLNTQHILIKVSTSWLRPS